jgi:hypothetical protein
MKRLLLPFFAICFLVLGCAHQDVSGTTQYQDTQLTHHANIPAFPVECDRDCLAGFMNTYLGAVLAHDPSKLPVTKNVKYTENGVRLNLNDGLWHTASAMPTYRVDVIDENNGQVGLLGRIDENGNNNWFAARLKVEKGELISEIETLITRTISMAPPPEGGSKAPEDPHPLMMQIIPEEKRMPPCRLMKIGNSYFTGLDTDNDGANVPFDPECQRRENGTTTANNPDSPEGSMQWMDCKAQFDTHFSTIVTDIRERRFIADPVTGLAFGWGYFDHDGSVEMMSVTLDDEMTDVGKMMRQPFSFYIAEIFKIKDGKIRQIEAVLTTVPYGMESGW